MKDPFEFLSTVLNPSIIGCKPPEDSPVFHDIFFDMWFDDVDTSDGIIDEEWVGGGRSDNGWLTYA